MEIWKSASKEQNKKHTYLHICKKGNGKSNYLIVVYLAYSINN